MLRDVGRNTLLNLAGMILPAMLSLVVTPIYIRTIGLGRYGALAVVWVMLGYFSAFDLGMGRATANRVARLRAASPEERSLAVWTAIVVNAGFGLLGGALLLGLGPPLLGGVFRMSDALRQEVLSALPWLSLAVPVMTVGWVLGGAIEGQERFLLLNALGGFNSALIQLAPLSMALFYGPNLTWLIASVVVARLTATALLGLAVGRWLPLVGHPRVGRSHLVGLITYGGWTAVSSLVGPLLVNLDQLLIGSRLGVARVPFYAIPSTLLARLQIVPLSLARALFPRLSRVEADAGRALAGVALRGLAALVTPAFVVAALTLEPFLTVWIGAGFAGSAAAAGEILVFGVWINSLALVPLTLIQGQGRPDLVAKVHLLELLPYVALLWLGTSRFGIEGAALAWTLRVAIEAVVLTMVADVPMSHVLPLLPASGIVVAAVALARDRIEVDAVRVLLSLGLLILAVLWSWWVTRDYRGSVWDRVAGWAGMPRPVRLPWLAGDQR